MRASCQCGSLTAEVDAAAEPMIVLCHCLECQRRSGSRFGEIAYYPVDRVTLKGDAREYMRPTDEGNTFTSGFCPTCGSPVYARASKYPGITGVTVGTMADPAFPPPNRSVYEQSRHPWIEIPSRLPRHLRGRNT